MKTQAKFLMHLFFFTWAGIANARNVTIDKSNGGPNGYKNVNENHYPSGDASLVCKDPGYEACKWTIQPSFVAGTTNNQYTADQIAAIVEQQIFNNVLQGSFYLDGAPNIAVNWNSIDVENYTMSVNDSEN